MCVDGFAASSAIVRWKNLTTKIDDKVYKHVAGRVAVLLLALPLTLSRRISLSLSLVLRTCYTFPFSLPSVRIGSFCFFLWQELHPTQRHHHQGTAFEPPSIIRSMLTFQRFFFSITTIHSRCVFLPRQWEMGTNRERTKRRML